MATSESVLITSIKPLVGETTIFPDTLNFALFFLAPTCVLLIATAIHAGSWKHINKALLQSPCLTPVEDISNDI